MNPEEGKHPSPNPSSLRTAFEASQEATAMSKQEIEMLGQIFLRI